MAFVAFCYFHRNAPITVMAYSSTSAVLNDDISKVMLLSVLPDIAFVVTS